MTPERLQELKEQSAQCLSFFLETALPEAVLTIPGVTRVLVDQTNLDLPKVAFACDGLPGEHKPSRRKAEEVEAMIDRIRPLNVLVEVRRLKSEIDPTPSSLSVKEILRLRYGDES